MSSTTYRIAAAVMAAFLVLTPAGALAQDETVPWPTDGWPTSTPEEQGMDSALLAEGLQYLLEQNGFDIHSLTVIRNGHIVADAYFYPSRADELHDLASVTKSFTATLVGMAIEQGLIEGVDQPVLELFPDRTVANLDTDKEAMTIEDLLTMSPGFECTHSPNDYTTMQMMETPDWVQFALDQPMVTPPGTYWVYCSPASHLLSAIITESAGMSTRDFAQDVLFAPLGITDSMWTSDPQGYDYGWGDLFLDPHDAAKLGYLYLHDGAWDGQQVLPADWVSIATRPAVASTYGYQWWLDPRGPPSTRMGPAVSASSSSPTRSCSWSRPEVVDPTSTASSASCSTPTSCRRSWPTTSCRPTPTVWRALRPVSAKRRSRPSQSLCHRCRRPRSGCPVARSSWTTTPSVWRR